MNDFPDVPENGPPSLEAVLGERKAKWPSVIGIVCIVFGAGGLLMALFQMGSVALQMNNFDQMRDADIEVRAGLESDYKTATTILIITSILISGLLLTGGILLLKRKKSAPLLLKIWAVLRIVVGGSAVFYVQSMSAEISKLAFELMAKQGLGGSKEFAETMGGAMSIVSKITIVTGFIWLAALPVFILIWMTRAKNKREIATW